MKYEIILPYAIELYNELKPYCNKIEIAGSVRRKAPECKDVEIVCIPDKFYLEEHLNYMKHSGKIRFIKNGAKYKQFKYKSNTIDLFIGEPGNFGWLLLYRTGSQNFNMRFLTQYRYKNHIPVNQLCSCDGWLRDSVGNRITTPDEQSAFNEAGMVYIEPEHRHN